MPAQSTAHIVPPQDQYLLFWDGECGFCRRAVKWASNRDKTGRLSPPMDPILSAVCAHALHLLHPIGHIERAGRACLTVLALIGWPPFIIDRLRQPPMIWTLEIGYWLVARNRFFFSKILFR